VSAKAELLVRFSLKEMLQNFLFFITVNFFKKAKLLLKHLIAQGAGEQFEQNLSEAKRAKLSL